MAWGEIAYHEWHDGSPWFWIDLAGGLLSFPIAHYRRRWPVGTALVLTLFGLFSMSAAGPAVLTVVSLFTRRNLKQIVPIALLNIVCGQLYSYYQPSGNQDPEWVTFAFNVVLTVA